jgi:hypothetical protein
MQSIPLACVVVLDMIDYSQPLTMMYHHQVHHRGKLERLRLIHLSTVVKKKVARANCDEHVGKHGSSRASTAVSVGTSMSRSCTQTYLVVQCKSTLGMLVVSYSVELLPYALVQQTLCSIYKLV